MDRGGLRLKLFKAQAEAGDLVLLFADESEAVTHPYLARLSRAPISRAPGPRKAQTFGFQRQDRLKRSQ